MPSFPRATLVGTAILGLTLSALPVVPTGASPGAAFAQKPSPDVRGDHWRELGISIDRRTSPAPALPPLPDPSEFSGQLVLDDGEAEGVFGLEGPSARQFLWLNSFDPGGPFTLEEIWVLFPAGTDAALGGAVQLAVWTDPDGDPRNGGAVLRATYDVTIQANDGLTFSVYPVAPFEIPDAGNILIGVVNRYFDTGIDTPPTRPAAYDSTVSQQSSYFALWAGDVPEPPDLATATLVDIFDGAVTGNFMIRGFGTGSNVLEVPVLDREGLAGLILALALAGTALLLRRRVG